MDSLSTSHLQWVPDGMGEGEQGGLDFSFGLLSLEESPVSKR